MDRHGSRQGVGVPLAAHGTCAGGGPATGVAPAARGIGGLDAGGARVIGSSITALAVGSQTGVPAADDLSPSNSKWKQEMNIDECVSSLRKRIQRLHPRNADGIVSYMISRKTPVEIRQYLLASDDQIQRLIVEAKSSSLPSVQQFPLLPPPQPLSGGIYIPFINWQPQFHPSGSFHGIQPPLYPTDQVGPLQQHQLHPSGSSHGIQAQNTPIGPTGAFQSPFPGIIGLGEHFQCLSIPGDGLPSNYGDACQSVTGYPPRSSKEQTMPFHFHFSMGYCKKGENCPFSHGSDSPEMNNVRRVRTLESLPMLEKEISELLLSLKPPRVPIESLANIYIKKYEKPLKIECSCKEASSMITASPVCSRCFAPPE